jgi:hypothetical protein
MNDHNDKIRNILVSQTSVLWLVRFHISLFENASVDNAIFIGQKCFNTKCAIKVVDIKKSVTEINDPVFS